MQTELPILITTYNRPRETASVIKSLEKVKPKRLFVSADGPKNNREDKLRCQEVKTIVQNIPLDCQISTRFADTNKGCKKHVSEAISWFFQQVSRGVILEDDCIPHPTFFEFCEALLDKYQNDKRVMHISGNNFQFGHERGQASYYFSRYTHIWGWATWSKAWKNYDVTMESYPEFKRNELIRNIFPDGEMRNYFLDRFDAVYENRLDTWDYQWTYAVWSQNGLCINPNKNLVTNVGFGENATHTKRVSEASHLQTHEINEVTHPQFVIPDLQADEYTYRKLYRKNLLSRLKSAFLCLKEK